MTSRRRDDEETDVYTVVTPPPVAVQPELYPAPDLAPGPPPPEFAAPPNVYPAYRRPAYSTVGRVVFAGVVLLVFGAGQALAGSAGAVMAGSLRRLIDQTLRAQGIRIESGAVLSVVIGIFVVLLVLGILHVVASVGVLSHRNWGRVLGVLLSLAGTLVGVYLVVRVLQGDSPRVGSLLAPLSVLIPYLVCLAALISPGDHFRRG